MVHTYAFHDVGRLPAPGDNVAIASRRLPAGARITHGDHAFTTSHAILEGHRFALVDIAAGDALLSWGLPFGVAICDIAPGAYVCNAKILNELRSRHVDFDLPETANFEDKIEPYLLDEAAFTPGAQVPSHAEPRSFLGYGRPGNRGVGTRNDIVILGTSSRTAGYARALAARLQGAAAAYEHIDDIVAVAHTEGGGAAAPNNLTYVLRTLSGFLVHPNVGAVLAVDDGAAAVTNALLKQYADDHDYPLSHVTHQLYDPTRRLSGRPRSRRSRH